MNKHFIFYSIIMNTLEKLFFFSLYTLIVFNIGKEVQYQRDGQDFNWFLSKDNLPKEYKPGRFAEALILAYYNHTLTKINE